MADLKITPEMREIIYRSTISGNQLILPETLSRAEYQKINKVIEAGGGKWNRTKKAHVFPKSPTECLFQVVESRVVVDEKKARQAFYTPPEIAALVAREGQVKGKLVLEPSAGGGALARAAMEAGARGVTCVELDHDTALLLSNEFLVFEQDFLKAESGETLLRFESILMNPPFSKGQDLKHVRHALKFLEPGGTLVAIMPASLNFSRAGQDFLKEVELKYDYDIEPLPSGAFKESGTSVETVMLTVHHNLL